MNNTTLACIHECVYLLLQKTAWQIFDQRFSFRFCLPLSIPSIFYIPFIHFLALLFDVPLVVQRILGFCLPYCVD